MTAILRAWTAVAAERPLTTLTVTNGALGGLGDILAQTIESHNERHRFRWDYRRTLRFVAWGSLCAPLFHKWYLLLNRAFPLPVQSSGKASFIYAVSKRVATDQLVYAPLGIAGFFVAMNFMEGQDWASAKRRLGEFYLPTLKANYAVWPAVQAVNFGFVPVLYRVPFSSVVSIFWNAFMSWANAQSASKVELPVEMPHTTVEAAQEKQLQLRLDEKQRNELVR
ncbi:hypothetical protein LPJ53_001847 [Coemansia erecta]|uniref:Uncharacterized protein n=1 Tax=Coemansia erecta TaxID=147472 RepID=A0A9W8CTM6_9FUNG|nr:hypothetical protein LPJ53_001847 [Coemansia erecta]